MHLRAFDLHVRALLSSRQHEARSQAHTKVAQVKARLLAKVLEILRLSKRKRPRSFKDGGQEAEADRMR